MYEDLLDIADKSKQFHDQLISTISACKEFLGLNYYEIMKLPLKTFYSLLKARRKEEDLKKDYLAKEQQKNTVQLESQKALSNRANNKTAAVGPKSTWR